MAKQKKIRPGIIVMQAFFGFLAKWFDHLNRALAAVACTLLVLITLAVCGEIFTRSFFRYFEPVVS